MGAVKLLQGALSLILGVGCGATWAQQSGDAGAKPKQPLNIPVPQAVDPAGPTATLHVYANLEQVPVLVLTPGRERMNKLLPESRFRVSLDSGPLFKPTHVRQEGDDPISLAILIDPKQSNHELLLKVQEAVAGLGLGPLNARDRVFVYAIDCNLIRTYTDGPADPAQLRGAVVRALDSYERRRNHHTSACRPAVPLWDSLALVIGQLAQEPGRRVLIALTDGEDNGSRFKWSQVKEQAQRNSVAVFGLMSTLQQADAGPVSRLGNPPAVERFVDVEDKFDLICELSGGMEMHVSASGLTKQMAWLVQVVRERYIVEFPRSDNATAGRHGIEVKVLDSLAFIRPCGIAVPLADQKMLANPLTIPDDPDKAPVEGTRKVLAPQ